MAVVKGLLKGIAGFPSEVELLGCDYSLNRHTDQLGKPTSEPNGGTISLVFQSLPQACWDWMVNSEMKPEGKIEFVDSEKKVFKTLSFKNAYCINYGESFSMGGNTESLVISCQTLTVGQNTFENTWGGISAK